MPQDEQPTPLSASSPADPPKRGRGRPRKSEAEKAAAAAAKPKRKRGRPRKSEAEKAAAAAKPKRKRGRPRKHPLPEDTPQPKRGPGRPPKNPKPEAAEDDGPAFEPSRGKPHRMLRELNLVRPENLILSRKDKRKLLSDEELNRVRMKELSAALEYELRQFEDQLAGIVEDIYEDVLLQVAELRSEIRRKMAGQADYDDESVVMVTRVVEKAAGRLVDFRDEDDISLSDLAKLGRRLSKALDRLRRA